MLGINSSSSVKSVISNGALKAKRHRQDDDGFMLWFRGRDLGNVILTKEMEYLKRNAEFLSRVRGGILVVDLEEL